MKIPCNNNILINAQTKTIEQQAEKTLIQGDKTNQTKDKGFHSQGTRTPWGVTLKPISRTVMKPLSERLPESKISIAEPLNKISLKTPVKKLDKIDKFVIEKV